VCRNIAADVEASGPKRFPSTYVCVRTSRQQQSYNGARRPLARDNSSARPSRGLHRCTFCASPAHATAAHSNAHLSNQSSYQATSSAQRNAKSSQRASNQRPSHATPRALEHAATFERTCSAYDWAGAPGSCPLAASCRSPAPAPPRPAPAHWWQCCWCGGASKDLSEPRELGVESTTWSHRLVP
jgi:hypothetical protein